MPRSACSEMHDLIELLTGWFDDVQRLDPSAWSS